MTPKICAGCKQMIHHNPFMPKIYGEYCTKYGWNLKDMENIPKSCYT